MLRGLNHITLAVSNLDNSLAFYTQLLGIKEQARWKNGAYLTVGPLWLCLIVDAVDTHTDYSHIAFDIFAKDFAAFAAKLRDNNVVEWKDNTSEGDSIYFLDPDGHKLEAHCGNLTTRLNSFKSRPFDELF